MSPVRRLAAAAAVAILSVSLVGIASSPAEARDFSWGARIPVP
jgi:hypothetical protein